VHITGRSKEIIVLSNGKNINPIEIEHKLKEQSDYIGEVGVLSAG
jgi:long-chain acyl-CoA synthetase